MRRPEEIITGQAVILTPGSSYFFVHDAPKMSESDTVLYLKQKADGKLPGRSDFFTLDYFSTEAAGKLSCAAYMIRTDLLEQIRAEAGSRRIYPAIAYLMMHCKCRDGVYAVSEGSANEKLVLIGGSIAQSDHIPPKSSADAYAHALPVFEWQFASGTEGLPTMDHFSDTPGAMYGRLRRKRWFRNTGPESRMVAAVPFLILSLLLLSLALTLPQVFRLREWRSITSSLESDIRQLETASADTLPIAAQDFRGRLPVKFTPVINALYSLLDYGDYISSIDFRDGSFTIDFIGSNPFSKRDALSSMDGFSNISVSRISGLDGDSRERFSISGIYSYESGGGDE
jgi:hypothetical protein